MSAPSIGERIGRIVARIAMNAVGLVLVLSILLLGASQSVAVCVAAVALMVPVFVVVEAAVAFAKVEPPKRGGCGFLAFAVAAPALLAVAVTQCRERAPGTATVACRALPTPNASAAIERLIASYQ